MAGRKNKTIQSKTEQSAKSLVKMSGDIISSTGEISLRSSYFEALGLGLEQYKDVSYTQEEAYKIRQHMTHLSTGSAAVMPLICPGENICPFSENCPFVSVDRERKRQYNQDVQNREDETVEIPHPEMTTPVGLPCLVEKNLLNEWTRLYVQEFEVDESFVDLGICRELAEIEVMLWRINNNLSKIEYAEGIVDEVVAVSQQGTAYTKKAESALMKIKETHIARKTKLIKLMVGDRQEKYKKQAALKTTDKDDPSTTAAGLRNQIILMQTQLNQKKLLLKDNEGNIVDIDNGTEEQNKQLTPQNLIDEKNK